MKEIYLTRDCITKVDNEDYDFLMQWKWFAMPSGKVFYAGRNGRDINNKRITIYMHKVLLGLTKESILEGDHIDRDTLNNQKSNLRHATRSQNVINKTYTNISNYKGVIYRKDINKYRVVLCVNGKQKHFGHYDTVEEAAKKHDIIALKYQGEFAVLNFK